MIVTIQDTISFSILFSQTIPIIQVKGRIYIDITCISSKIGRECNHTNIAIFSIFERSTVDEIIFIIHM